MVHADVESEGALFVSRRDFYETLSIMPVFLNSLICESFGSGGQQRMVFNARIPRMAIFGVRLLFSKKFVMLVMNKVTVFP